LGDLQNEQSEQAVRNLLEIVAGDIPESATSRGVVGVSKNIIAAARDTVKAETQPFYDAAVDSAEAAGIKVDISPVLQQLNDLQANAKGSVRKTLDAAALLFKTTDGKGWDTSMSGLQGTKWSLDALINGKVGDESVDAVTRARLIEIKAALEKQMGDASPMYRKANEMYRDMSQRLVTPLQDGLVGTLANLEQQGMHKAARSAAKLVTDQNLSLQDLIRLKTDFGQAKGGKAAWRGVSKMWLQGALERAAKETQGGNVVNFPGKFRQAVYGTPAARARAKVVLGESFDTFDELMKAFDMAARVPVRGSNTQADQLITRSAGSRVAGAVRAVRSLGTSVLDSLDDRAAVQFADDIAMAMTDPTKLRQLKLVQKMPASMERALLMIGVVTNNAAEAGTGLGAPVDRPVEMAQ